MVLSRNVKNWANFALVCLSCWICCWACFAFFWLSCTRLTASSVTLFTSSLTHQPTSIPSRLGHISFAIQSDKMIKWQNDKSCTFRLQIYCFVLEIQYQLRIYFLVLIFLSHRNFKTNSYSTASDKSDVKLLVLFDCTKDKEVSASYFVLTWRGEVDEWSKSARC